MAKIAENKIMNDTVNPITIRDTETGDVFTLEFDRESVKFAESRGFKIEDVGDFPMTKIPELFWYAFRKNHKRVSKEQAERILDLIGGLRPGLMERLGQLYALPFNALTNNDDDGEEKNGRMTVEF